MEKEQKEMIDSIVADVKKGMLTEENVKQILSEQLKDINKTEIDSIKDSILKQAEALKGIEEKMTSKPELKTIDAIVEANKAKISDAMKNNGKIELFIPKTAVQTSAVSNNPAGILQMEIARPAFGMPTMAQILGGTPIPRGNNHAVGFWYRSTSTRNADNIAENATTTDSAAAWTYGTVPIEKIFDWIPFTLEVDFDVAWLSAEIDAFIRENLMIKENYQLLHGTGTTPQIQGIIDYATTFDATDYAGTVKSANTFDLIMKVVSKITNGKNSRFMPNRCVVNPTDFNNMLSTKNDFGSYEMPAFARLIDQNTMQVGSVIVTQDADVVADTMVIFDSGKVKRYNNGIEIAIGLNGNDLIYDRQTLVGRIREAVVINPNDALAFYKVASIAADVAEINIIGA